MYRRNPILPNEKHYRETTNTFEKYKEIPESELDKAGIKMLQIQTEIAGKIV